MGKRGVTTYVHRACGLVIIAENPLRAREAWTRHLAECEPPTDLVFVDLRPTPPEGGAAFALIYRQTYA